MNAHRYLLNLPEDARPYEIVRLADANPVARPGNQRTRVRREMRRFIKALDARMSECHA